MVNTNSAQHTLEIDGMSGDACIKKVSDSLKGLNGVTTQGVELGSATIAANDEGCKSACEAIGRAGFKSRESNRFGDTSKTANSNSGQRQNDHKSDTGTRQHESQSGAGSGQHENKGDGRTTSPAPSASPPVTTGNKPTVGAR